MNPEQELPRVFSGEGEVTDFQQMLDVKGGMSNLYSWMADGDQFFVELDHHSNHCREAIWYPNRHLPGRLLSNLKAQWNAEEHHA